MIDGCDQARPITYPFPTHNDLVVGPLSYGGLKYFANDPVQESNWTGGYFYKTGAQLRPGVTATITIADEAAPYAAIVTENAPAGGARSVTYQSCTKAAGTVGSAWVGGFVLWSRKSACLRPRRDDHPWRGERPPRCGLARRWPVPLTASRLPTCSPEVLDAAVGRPTWEFPGATSQSS